MTEIIAKLTSKGQLTIPIEVRHLLGLSEGSKVHFVIHDDGRITVEAPRYPDIRSLAGVAGSLKKPLPWKKVLAVAYEDRFADSAADD